MACCALCNDAEICYADGEYKRTGEPTEAALKVLVEKIGHMRTGPSHDPAAACSATNRRIANGVQRLATLEFSRKRKSMSVLCRSLRGERPPTLYVKGAPESTAL